MTKDIETPPPATARSRSTTTPAAEAPGQPDPAEAAIPAHRQQAAPARGLSKAFASRVGFIAACDEAFTGHFKMGSHPSVFSSTLLPHEIAGLTETLAVVRQDTWRRTRLQATSTRVRKELTAAGIDLHGSASHILALVAGDERQVMTMRGNGTPQYRSTSTGPAPVLASVGLSVSMTFGCCGSRRPSHMRG
ncbi:aminotransferase class I/II-fold pyridoxal phosphate-dependent enzyme [Streptomyces sp. NBC_00249]|nr:aminotransferase class I/II-fold pyridoxal phosphate-dependent enzyme [Streptomyces sp. NBC_00249]